MKYYKLLASFDSPATATDVLERAREHSPTLHRSTLPRIRAALAYMVKTGKARRVGNGKYEAIRTKDNSDVLRLVIENNQLKEQLRTMSRAFALAQKILNEEG